MVTCEPNVANEMRTMNPMWVNFSKVVMKAASRETATEDRYRRRDPSKKQQNARRRHRYRADLCMCRVRLDIINIQ